jgi:hypothetical protein
MTRDDHIYNQAAEYAIELTQGLTTGKSCAKRGCLFSGFMDGAHWADENPHWISVYDQLPPYNEKVLVFYGIDRYIGIAMLEDVVGLQTFWSDGRKSVYHITHWMPLPAQPKEGGDQ